jgi:HSP20 family molecular chaperone IbpA
MASGRSWQPWQDDARWRESFGARQSPRTSEQWVWGAAPVAAPNVRCVRQGDHLVVEVALAGVDDRTVDVHVGRNAILVRGAAGTQRIDLPVTVQAARARVRRSPTGFEVTVPTGG